MAQQITGIKKHAFSSPGPATRPSLRVGSGSLREQSAKAQLKITQATNGTIQNSSSKEIELNRRYFIVGERRISSYWWASVFFVGGFGFLITGISSYIKYNLFASVFEKMSSLMIGIIGAGVSETAPSPQVFLESEGTGAFTGGPFVGGESLVFFPQGLLMCFYGSLGLLLSVYWWLLIYWNVGGGFNEFNKKEGFMRIFRWGYPGKNRRIDIVYSLKDIEAIRVELKQSQGLLASEQTIFVRLLSLPAIPLTSSATSTATIYSSAKNEGIGKLKEKREIPLGGIGQPLTLKEIEKQASELANYLQVALEGL